MFFLLRTSIWLRELWNYLCMSSSQKHMIMNYLQSVYRFVSFLLDVHEAKLVITERITLESWNFKLKKSSHISIWDIWYAKGYDDGQKFHLSYSRRLVHQKTLWIEWQCAVQLRRVLYKYISQKNDLQGSFSSKWLFIFGCHGNQNQLNSLKLEKSGRELFDFWEAAEQLIYHDILASGFKYFLFSPRKLGKWFNLTNIFQMGWNHQSVYQLIT